MHTPITVSVRYRKRYPVSCYLSSTWCPIYNALLTPAPFNTTFRGTFAPSSRKIWL